MENEERVSNTPWQIRCSIEQKRSFQKFVEQTGLTAQEAIARAFESFQIQASENAENSNAKKILFEFDTLVGRLQSMMRAQIIVALEKQRQCEEEKSNLTEEQNKFQRYYDETYEKIDLNFQENLKAKQKEYEDAIFELKSSHKIELDNMQKEFIELKEKIELDESKIENLEKEKSILQKQSTDSMRLYESLDERNYDLKKQNERLEKEVSDLKKYYEKSFHLEKMVDELKHKMDLLKVTAEQQIKRMESEHELKCKILSQQIEHKTREQYSQKFINP